MSVAGGRQGHADQLRLHGRPGRHGELFGRCEQHPERGRRPELVLTRRPFLMNELQLWEDGVNMTPST